MQIFDFAKLNEISAERCVSPVCISKSAKSENERKFMPLLHTIRGNARVLLLFIAAEKTKKKIYRKKNLRKAGFRQPENCHYVDENLRSRRQHREKVFRGVCVGCVNDP